VGPPLLDYEQAAELLNVSPFTLRTWVQHQQVPFVRLSRKAVRFNPEALTRWIDQRSTEPRVSAS
jgi:excisionase family DNA binding protein